MVTDATFETLITRDFRNIEIPIIMAQQSEEINRCCFWVTRVSETVFSTDPDVSLRVRLSGLK